MLLYVPPPSYRITRSAALGEMSDRGLYDIFQAQFGAPGSPPFEAARAHFIVSEAGYAIASYLLQVGLCGACWRFSNV